VRVEDERSQPGCHATTLGTFRVGGNGILCPAGLANG